MHEIFFTVTLPCPLHGSRRAVVRFWQKNVHKYWVTPYRIKSAQEKDGYVTNGHNMALIVLTGH